MKNREKACKPHLGLHALIANMQKVEILSRAALPFISTLDGISAFCYLNI